MDDLISRKAAVEAFDRIPRIKGLGFELLISVSDAKDMLAGMKAVDAIPVQHGRWEYSENIYDDSTWVCSICEEPWTLIAGTPQENGMKYCPNCGAKMDLEE